MKVGVELSICLAMCLLALVYGLKEDKPGKIADADDQVLIFNC